MFIFSILVAGAAASMSAPAAAKEADKTEASAAKSEKKVCRREVATGSIMARPVCRTLAEWDALAAKGRDDIDRVRDQDSLRSAVQGAR